MTTQSASPPTLSILIPVHNWNIGSLLTRLQRQIVSANVALEVDIHVFDDASGVDFAAAIRAAVKTANGGGARASLHRSDVNLGRSGARNALVERTSGRYLLFLDADVLPDGDDFLATYIAHAQSGAGALCGGVSYVQCPPPADDSRFYHRYSSRVSVAAASVRNLQPWAWLFTANVMVDRALVADIPFDPGFSGYGYEDLEWGIRLARQGRLVHIDNSVTHLGLLSKAVLRRKTQESPANLVHMSRLHPVEASQLRLVRVARRLRPMPAWALRQGARVAGALFSNLPGPFRAEHVAFQLEKVLLVALAFKASNGEAAERRP